MALIAMAVYDTAENQRTQFTRVTLQSLSETVNWDRHRLILIDNASHEPTQELYAEFADRLPFELIRLDSNRGTARAVNQGWLKRRPGEHAVKMDNDVRFRDRNWCDRLEDCVDRDEKLGIIGLKRPDCIESPWTEGWYKSELRMLPHERGQSWLVVEVANHVMGTCQLFSSRLLDRIGFLYQFGGLYGFDDSLAAARCAAAGFYSAFLCNVHIDHVDPGSTPYQQWKQKYASERFQCYHQAVASYFDGSKPIYYGPDDE